MECDPREEPCDHADRSGERWHRAANSVRAVLQEFRDPINDAITYLIADAEAWERRAKDDGGPHEVYSMKCGKLRRDIAARLQSMLDVPCKESADEQAPRH